MTTRFGIGYDAHPLRAGVPLVLAGVSFSHDHGLDGHSDGDVATHAVIDAMLGAAALGDMGTHFKADDPSVAKGVSSLTLLERTVAILADAGWRLVNVDATIVAQQPRLSEHITAMRNALAAALGTGVENVSVKATTEDGMGFTGTRQGIAAIAVASIAESNS
jgi:2-C-methyl-D-erythritol 2,4-cyclodiphosphate synthase